MGKSKFIQALLLVSGLIGIGIGGALLFVPVAFEASAGIALTEDVNLLSEIRAPGGALFIGGIFIFSGAFYTRLTFTSLVLSSLFFLAYGLSRIFGILVDGVPGDALLFATLLEIGFGLANLFALIAYTRKHSLSYHAAA